MGKYHIGLTDKEKALVDGLPLHRPAAGRGRGVVKGNADKVVELLGSLLRREAVPEARRRYWTDPEYCTARGRSSRAEIFAGSGRTREEVYRDPRFLPYLRYFLFGSALPDAAIEEFEAELAAESVSPESFTSGDHEPMWRTARRLTRQHGLVKSKRWAAEEFLKLCLDMGFDIDVARSVRDAVMKVR